MDDRRFEVGSLGRLGLDQIADIRDVLDDRGVTRPPTIRATIASANSKPRKSAGSVRGSMQVMTYRPLRGRNGKRGV
jgi:hypothetical protein